MTRAPLSAMLSLAIVAAIAPAAAGPVGSGAVATKSAFVHEPRYRDHTMLLSFSQVVGLSDTLSEGGYTMLAPTNAAFGAMDGGGMPALLDGDGLAAVRRTLECHVLSEAARLDALRDLVAQGGGTHAVTTLGGCVLTMTESAGMLRIEDEAGRIAQVAIDEMIEPGGNLLVIDAVLAAD